MEKHEAENVTTPGFHKMFRIDGFDKDEQSILKRLSKEWYLTNSGEAFSLGATSKYRFFLMKPTLIFSEMFNIDREIICVFSPYGMVQKKWTYLMS